MQMKKLLRKKVTSERSHIFFAIVYQIIKIVMHYHLMNDEVFQRLLQERRSICVDVQEPLHRRQTVS